MIFLEQQVKGDDRHPGNLRDLREQLLTEWLELDVNINHINLMPRRISAVILENGGGYKILVITYFMGLIFLCIV